MRNWNGQCDEPRYRHHLKYFDILRLSISKLKVVPIVLVIVLLAASEAAPGQSSVILNQTTGYLSGAGDADLYQTPVQRSGTVLVTLEGPSGQDIDFDIYVKVGSSPSTTEYDARGYTNSSSEVCQINVFSPTTIYTLVRSFEGAGNYNVRIQLMYDSGGQSETTNLLVESPHPYSNEYHESWTVRSLGASEIRIHFSKIETEPEWDYVRLYDADENLVAFYSGSYTNTWSPWVEGGVIVVELSSDVSVTGYGFRIDRGEVRGSNSRTVRDPWDPTDDRWSGASPIAINTTTTYHSDHTLDQQDQNDWFSFRLIAGTYYTFASVNATVDTVAQLYNDQINQVASDDDSGSSNNFELTYRPVSTGTYYLCVNAYNVGSGMYTLAYHKRY